MTDEDYTSAEADAGGEGAALADELRASADAVERQRARERSQAEEAARKRHEDEVARALVEDFPAQAASLRSLMRAASREGARSVEWRWDTLYPSGKEYGNSEPVCLAVQNALRELFESEGLKVEDAYGGHRHPRIDAEGYSLGGSYSAYGGLVVSW